MTIDSRCTAAQLREIINIVRAHAATGQKEHDLLEEALKRLQLWVSNVKSPGCLNLQACLVWRPTHGDGELAVNVGTMSKLQTVKPVRMKLLSNSAQTQAATRYEEHDLTQETSGLGARDAIPKLHDSARYSSKRVR